jgi:hypothetical protein
VTCDAETPPQPARGPASHKRRRGRAGPPPPSARHSGGVTRTRCPDEVARHSYNTNSVEGFSYTLSAEQNWYDTKCERMTAWDDYSVIFSRICNSHRVTTGRWDDFCGNCEQYENAGVLLKVYAGNDAPRNQKIYGNGVY